MHLSQRIVVVGITMAVMGIAIAAANHRGVSFWIGLLLIWLLSVAVMVAAQRIARRRIGHGADRLPSQDARSSFLASLMRVRVIALLVPLMLVGSSSIVGAFAHNIGQSVALGAVVGIAVAVSWLLSWRFNRDSLERWGYRW
jgi:hypothetical protein